MSLPRTAPQNSRLAGWPLLPIVMLAACATYRASQAGPVVVGHTVVGTASWYGPGFHGRRTASGERFDQEAFTAAHPNFPFGTRLRVTLLVNKRSVVVRINDRLPRRNRIIDLSRAAARAIDLVERGTGKVRLEVIALD